MLIATVLTITVLYQLFNLTAPGRAERHTMNGAHTKLPWRVISGNETWVGGVVISDSENCHVATATRGKHDAQTNAALIVRAVNCHERLLEQCRRLLNIVECTGKLRKMYKSCIDESRAVVEAAGGRNNG